MDQTKAILLELQATLQQLYGERLVRLVLYGSYARGEATEESDLDVMVVLKGAVNPVLEIARMNGAAFDIGLEHNVLVSTVPVSEDDFNRSTSPLFVNVRREGIPV